MVRGFGTVCVVQCSFVALPASRSSTALSGLDISGDFTAGSKCDDVIKGIDHSSVTFRVAAGSAQEEIEETM
jgi:hypothetical protein